MPEENTGTRGQVLRVKLARRARRLASRLQDAAERLLGKNLLWGLVFVALLAPIASQQECSLPAPAYKAGEVAATTIKAPYDIELFDEKATRERREAERDDVPPVYDLVVDLLAEQRARLTTLFDRGRAALKGRRGARVDADTMTRVRAQLGEPIPDNALRTLIEQSFSPEAEAAALRIHAAIMQGRIVWSRKGLPEKGAIAIREVQPEMMVEATFDRLDQIHDLDEAHALLAQRVDLELPDWPEPQRKGMTALLDGFIVSNLTYNPGETERRRANAVASVPQVFMRIPRGRVIVREGEVFTQDQVDIVSKMQGGGSFSINGKSLAGNAIILSLLASFLYRYVEAHQRMFHRVKNLYTLALLVTTLTTVGSWIGVFISGSVADRMTMAPFSDPGAYYWALPVSAGAMLMTLLADSRVATVCSACIAVLFGMALDWNAQAIMFALLSSFAAIHGISKYERRTAILKASVLVALVNMALVFALSCLENGLSPASACLFAMGMSGLGAILAAPVVSFTLPIMEWLFNVLTDIRLLELSNLDNPLLRRLSMEAPGTYNHSIIVGTLAEQAAEEIRAHALLCRVAAYYHDIGKMSKPDYFVENMRDGANRHDKLSPRMSSLIIANHVKEGLRLAEEYGLPRQIRDIIPQHHGTRLITFFYRKAKRKEDPEVPEIHESDYRYPGPRPQTKEAAIFMMADSVEAAARTVEEPTPAKFEEVISQVSDAIVLDHQFDECDLTFSDLEKIRASFLKTLSAVHHHRIAYPGFDFDRSRPRVVEAE